MARIKLVYVGGGSTRAAGTMASLISQGADFAGSEVVLVDLDPDRLALIRRSPQQMAKAEGVDLTSPPRPTAGPALKDCRRGALELPSRRLRGPGARRADPPQARRASARRRRARAGSSWRCGRSR